MRQYYSFVRQSKVISHLSEKNVSQNDFIERKLSQHRKQSVVKPLETRFSTRSNVGKMRSFKEDSVTAFSSSKIESTIVVGLRSLLARDNTSYNSEVILQALKLLSLKLKLKSLSPSLPFGNYCF